MNIVIIISLNYTYINPLLSFFPSHILEYYTTITQIAENFRLMILIKTGIHLPRTKKGGVLRSDLFFFFFAVHYRLSEVVWYSDREIMEEKTPMRVYLKWSEIKMQGGEKIGRLIAESVFSW